MSEGFTQRLGRRIRAGQAPAVVGLDPRLDALPEAIGTGRPAERIVAFYRLVLPVLAPHVPVVKPNIAFFEQFGAQGFGAYETVCGLAREAGLAVIGDIKRGDIGSTAAAYAAEHFRHADALTLHPYLGRDSIEPFLVHCRASGKAVFVLVRTTNPSAVDLQDLATPAGTLSEVVADHVSSWGEEFADEFGFSSVGAVVAATYAGLLESLRGRLPRAWLLIPGVGAQGGQVADLGPAFDARGLGALVTQSRGILECFAPTDPDWIDQVEAAVQAFTGDLKRVSSPAS